MSEDARVIVWDAKTGTSLAAFEHRRRRSSADDDEDATEAEDGTSIDGGVIARAFAARDGVAAIGLSDGSVSVFDVERGARLHRTSLARNGPVVDVVDDDERERGNDAVVGVAIGGGWIVARARGGAIKTMSARDGGGTKTVLERRRRGGGGGGGGDAGAGTSSSDGDVASLRVLVPSDPPYLPHDAAADASEDGTSIDASTTSTSIVVHARSNRALAIDGADAVLWPLVLGEDDDDAGAGEIAGDEIAVRLRGHAARIRAACFATCGGGGVGVCSSSFSSRRVFVVTGGDDASVRVWDARAGRCLRTLEGPPGVAEAVHAGQVPVEWSYRPPPATRVVRVWGGVVVDGRDDGSVLAWSGVFDGLEAAEEDALRDDDDRRAVGRRRRIRGEDGTSSTRSRSSAAGGETDGVNVDVDVDARAYGAFAHARTPEKREDEDVEDTDTDEEEEEEEEYNDREIGGVKGLIRQFSAEKKKGQSPFATSSSSSSFSNTHLGGPSSSPGGASSPSWSRRPASYRRWWVHTDAVASVVVRGGRIVTVSVDGGCHVLPLPDDVLCRSHPHHHAAAAGGGSSASGVKREHIAAYDDDDFDDDVDFDRDDDALDDLDDLDGDGGARDALINASHWPSHDRVAGVPGGVRRLSSEFIDAGCRVAHLAWRNGSAALGPVSNAFGSGAFSSHWSPYVTIRAVNAVP